MTAFPKLEPGVTVREKATGHVGWVVNDPDGSVTVHIIWASESNDPNGWTRDNPEIDDVEVRDFVQAPRSVVDFICKAQKGTLYR